MLNVHIFAACLLVRMSPEATTSPTAAMSSRSKALYGQKHAPAYFITRLGWNASYIAFACAPGMTASYAFGTYS